MVRSMDDEIWVTKSGQKIPVAELSEDHAKNILRMLLRKNRDRQKKRAIELIAKAENLPIPEFWFEHPDNYAVLADLQRKHGNVVHVERASVAGMNGADVYVGDEHVGWFGGI